MLQWIGLKPTVRKLHLLILTEELLDLVMIVILLYVLCNKELLSIVCFSSRLYFLCIFGFKDIK